MHSKCKACLPHLLQSCSTTKTNPFVLFLVLVKHACQKPVVTQHNSEYYQQLQHTNHKWLVSVGLIIRLHRSTTYVDAVYCYRPSSVVCWSVCHTSEPCKNGCTDQDAVWVEESGGPKEPCIRWGPDPRFFGQGSSLFWAQPDPRWEGAILRGERSVPL